MADEPDLGDLLGHLIEAAEPVTKSGDDVVALERLAEVVKRIEAAQDKAEAATILAAELVANMDLLQGLGVAFQTRWNELQQQLITIRRCVSVRDCGVLEQAIQRAAQQRSATASAPALSRPDLDWLRVPWGYELRDDGVHLERSTKDGVSVDLVTPTPCFISELVRSAESGRQRVRIEFRQHGVWKDLIVDRSVARDPRLLMVASNDGLDIDTRNARDVVAWLVDQERACGPALPRSVSTRTMGWQSREAGFLVGNELIGEGSERVHFDGDEGHMELANAYETTGDLDGWREVVAPALRWPYPTIAVYASLAAPFLGLLSAAPNLILDWSSTTRKGKTTCLSVGASCWGRPRKGQHLVHSWDSSAAFLERSSAACRHLPFYLDDTRDAQRPENLERIVYMYAGGAGRGRASVDGLRKTVTTRGILLSTGEQALSGFGDAAGARARVLSLTGPPIPEGHGAEIRDLLAGLDSHHGTAGRALVRHLHERRDLWDSYRQHFASATARYAARLDGTVGDSVASGLALLDLGGYALHHVIGLDVGTGAMEVALEAAIASSTEASDRPLEALRAVWGWAVACQTRFYGRHVTMQHRGDVEPPDGWAGVWKSFTWWDEICFRPDVLKETLRRQGFTRPDEIIAGWRERGWLKKDGRNHRVYRSMNGQSIRMLVFSRDVLSEQLGEIQ